jgi:hypothetical protein
MNKELGIFNYYQNIKDPQLKRKKLHLLRDILTIAIAAVICGADTWDEIAAFGKAKKSWFSNFLELPNGIPSHDTFNRVFQLLAPSWINDCSINFFKTKIKNTREHIAIDGKVIRRYKWQSSSPYGKCMAI